MKPSLFVLLILSFLAPQLFADTTTKSESYPSAWKQVDGVEYSIGLTTSHNAEKTESVIRVYFKNSSNLPKLLAVMPSNDRGLSCYTIDNSGAKQPLHEQEVSQYGKTPQELLRKQHDETSRYYGPATVEEIAPGTILTWTIPISASELSRVKVAHFQCSFSVSDESSKQLHSIDSTPEVLTETIVDQSVK